MFELAAVEVIGLSPKLSSSSVEALAAQPGGESVRKGG